MCVCVCYFHSIFQKCSHLMTFPTLSIYGVYFFIAGKTILSIAKRNLNYLHLCVFERLTRMCAMLDTRPSTCPVCIPELYPVTAGMPAPYRHTFIRWTYQCMIQESQSSLIHISSGSALLITPLLPHPATVYLRYKPFGDTLKYSCTVKNNKTDDETNQTQQWVKLRPKGAETDACVRFPSPWGPSLITSATHTFSLFQLNQLLLLLEV